MLIILMGLVSCSSGGEGSDDLMRSADMIPISFSCDMAESQTVTRAGTPLSANNVETFKVWAYKNMTEGGMQTVMPGFTVNYLSSSANTTTSNTSGWEYVAQGPDQTIKYWDWGAADYRFFAIAGTYVDDGTGDENKARQFTMDADVANMSSAPYFSKLWYSTGQLPTYADKQFGKPVTLEFLKPFSRVRFIFKYVYPREGIKLKDPSFKPTDNSKIARKGKVTVIYPMTGSETQEQYTTTIDDPSVGLAAFTVDYDSEDDTKDYTGTGTDKGWYTVVPNINQKSYTLSVKINNVDKTAVVPEKYMQWLPGYSYTYIFKVTEEGGVEIGWVEYAVTPWVNLTSQQKLVYNW